MDEFESFSDSDISLSCSVINSKSGVTGTEFSFSASNAAILSASICEGVLKVSISSGISFIFIDFISSSAFLMVLYCIVISGTFAAWIFTLINRSLMKLSSSGNKVITSAIGKKGSVYLRIPAEGSGQIQINVSGRLEICDAVSADKAEIPFGEEVQVIGINKDKVLIVTTKFLKTDIK